MEFSVKEINMELNRLYKRQNEFYDRYANACGLSSPALLTLYAIYEAEEPLTQNQIAQIWCLPKQTVNFTVSSLVKKGCLRLEQIGGARNSKAVLLTDDGYALCDKCIKPLMTAEENSLLQLMPDERMQFLALSNKLCDYLEKEIIALISK